MAKKKKTETPKREYTRRQLSQFQKQKRRQRFLFFGGVSIIAVVIIIVLVGWLVGEYLPLHRTILKVNDVAFNTGYLMDILRASGVTSESEGAFMTAYDAVGQMAQDELLRQGAEKLDITVDDGEVIEKLEELDLPTDRGTVYSVKEQMLQERLRDYFDTVVPQSGKQVSAMMLMLESERQASDIRTQLISGGNFTAIAEEFSDKYYPGTIDEDNPALHPEHIYKSALGGATVPVNHAFSAEAGDWSTPILDERTSIEHGYWLIKVLSRSADSTENVTANITANVHALYLGSEQEAEGIKIRLEAGEDLGALADEFSQYALSKDNHGVINDVTPQRNVSDAFNNHVWNAETELGEWSEPIRDLIWTQGGYWLIKVIEVVEDEAYSEQDRNSLVSSEFSSWKSEQWNNPDNVIEQDYLTSDQITWIIEHL